MAVNKLKKINVRSPYYITVSKAEEADVDPTEPVTQESTITCGSTTQIGVDVGTRTFKISTTGRELGDFTISFSGIKTPIKYRIGHSANMPSYSTAGLDSYAQEWNIATGESPTLSDYIQNPNGISATAAYTSTQSDIDLYGEDIQLEIQQPIITEDYSFSLSCPALAEDTVPVDNGFVVIISLTKNNGVHPFAAANTLSVNGTQLGGLPTGSIEDTDRYIMTDQTPNLRPQNDNNFLNRNEFGTRLNFFENETAGSNVSIFYKPENIISSAINELKIENTSLSSLSAATMTLTITRHPVQNISGTNYILGSADGVTLERLLVNVNLAKGDSFDMTFRGSNSVELEGLLAFKTFAAFSGTTDWDEGAIGGGAETVEIPIISTPINPI